MFFSPTYRRPKIPSLAQVPFLSVNRAHKKNLSLHMKSKGSSATYRQERDKDLIRVYREVIARHTHIHLPSVIEEVVSSPSKRFWVSEERAKIVIAEMTRGKSLENMNQTRRNMYIEIYRRVLLMQQSRPDLPLSRLVELVIDEPAPCFYLTPQSAKVILHRIKKRCAYLEKKKRLKHLFM